MKRVVVAVCFWLICSHSTAWAFCFDSAADKFAVAPFSVSEYSKLLKAIAKKESSMRHISTNGHDYGLMQINKAYWRPQVTRRQWRRIERNPCSNVKFAAFVLAECITRLWGHDPARAIGSYHSPNRERARRYGRSILAGMYIDDRLAMR